MDSVKAKFHNIESEMLRRNLEVTAQSLVEVYNNGFAESKVSILSLFDAHNQQAKEKIKQNLIAQATYQKYLRTRYLLAQFLKSKLNKKDILVNDITPAMMEQFFVYLNGTMAKNTAIHKMKTLFWSPFFDNLNILLSFFLHISEICCNFAPTKARDFATT